jgi:hypothetical protein
LRLNEADKIGVSRGSQIGALGVYRANHDHQAGNRADHRGQRTSKRPAVLIPPSLRGAGSA